MKFRAVIGHPGYEVSASGVIRSIDRLIPHGRGGTMRRRKGQVLRPAPDAGGYPNVMLGRGVHRSVHSMVAAAFIGPCPPGQEVRHKNDNRTDPRACNLEYGTRHQNIMDAVERGGWHSAKRKKSWPISCAKARAAKARKNKK